MILYMVITPQLGHFYITNVGHNFTFSVILYVEGQPPYIGQMKVSCSFCVTPYMGWKHNSLTELPFAYSLPILSPQVWTINWNFITATDPLLYHKALINDRFMYLDFQVDNLPLQPKLHICTRVHSSFFIVPSGYHNTATCIYWAALNGSNCTTWRSAKFFEAR
jgi:hypothetical protein